jgi:hypothetical protein
MNFKNLQSLGLLAFLILTLTSCDTGRVGSHKVMFVTPARVDTAARSRQTDEEKLTQLIREVLVGKGFNEHPGTPHLWQKRGAWVEVYRDNEREFILKVRAFGSKHDVRVSERTEQELVAFLKQQPGMELTPMPPP